MRIRPSAAKFESSLGVESLSWLTEPEENWRTGFGSKTVVQGEPLSWSRETQPDSVNGQPISPVAREGT